MTINREDSLARIALGIYDLEEHVIDDIWAHYWWRTMKMAHESLRERLNRLALFDNTQNDLPARSIDHKSEGA